MSLRRDYMRHLSRPRVYAEKEHASHACVISLCERLQVKRVEQSSHARERSSIP